MTDYFSMVLPLLSTALCFSLGLFTLLRNPRHPANIGFAMGMASLVAIEAGSTMLMLSGSFESLFSPGIRVYMAGHAVLPAGWLLFTTVFARADRKSILSRQYPTLMIVSAISLVFTLLILLDGFMPGFVFMARWPSLSVENRIVLLGPAGYYMCVYILLGLVFNMVQLENTLRSSSGNKRWQIKYVIFGVGAILGFFIYQTSQKLLFSSISVQIIPLSSAVILVSTMMMAVFIIKHRLLDVDIFISRYVVYNSFTVFAVGLYLLVVGIVYFKVPFNYFFTSLFIFLAILALFILLFMQTPRRKAQLFINKHFYKHKYEFRDKWMETIEKISSKGAVSEIRTTLREMVSETMGAKPVYLWLYDPVSKCYQTNIEEVEPGLRKISADHAFSTRLKKDLSPFHINDIPATDRDGLAGIFTATGTVLCSPLVTDQEVIGFILQGPDQSAQPYIKDDFDILKAMTAQAAVQIKNIGLAQELMGAKEVDAFNRISSFLMHDLKNLTNSLSLISQNARHNMDNPEFQRDTIKTIDGTVSRMKRLIERLSNAPRGVELKKKRTDMNDLIGKVIKKTIIPLNKKITITREAEPLPPIYIDPEAVEMVIINLITNAYEAIESEGVIKVHADSREGFINIAVQDNGPGIPLEFIENALFRPFKTTKKNGFGIGLYQCKTVMEAHGGGISVESSAGSGTKFTIRLPEGA